MNVKLPNGIMVKFTRRGPRTPHGFIRVRNDAGSRVTVSGYIRRDWNSYPTPSFTFYPSGRNKGLVV